MRGIIVSWYHTDLLRSPCSCSVDYTLSVRCGLLCEVFPHSDCSASSSSGEILELGRQRTSSCLCTMACCCFLVRYNSAGVIPPHCWAGHPWVSMLRLGDGSRWQWEVCPSFYRNSSAPGPWRLLWFFFSCTLNLALAYLAHLSSEKSINLLWIRCFVGSWTALPTAG